MDKQNEPLEERTPKHVFKEGPRFSFKKSEYTYVLIQQFVLIHLTEFDAYDLRCILSILNFGISVHDHHYKIFNKYTLRNKVAKRISRGVSVERMFLVADYLEAIYNDP